MKTKLILLLSPFVFAACAKGASVDTQHNLPTSSHSADSPAKVACQAATNSVQNAIGSNSGATLSVVNPPAGCMVSVKFANAANVLPAMKKIKAISGSYAFVIGNNRHVGVWPMVATPPPPKDKSGKPVKKAPVESNVCNAAIASVHQLQPLATVTQASAGTSSGFDFTCYLDVAFHDDTSFESFFNSDNPFSATHDLFHIDMTNSQGNVASVPLHVFRGADIVQ